MSFSLGNFFTHVSQLLNNRPSRLDASTSPLSRVKVQVLPERIKVFLSSGFQLTGNGFSLLQQGLACGPCLWPKSQYQYDGLEDWSSPVCLGKEKIPEKGRSVVACRTDQ